MKYFVSSKLSENISETPEGYLLCLAVPIARTGEQEYGKGETPLDVGDNGRIMIIRDADQVFRPETIASFEGKPLTIRHPEEFVNPDNFQELTVGHIQNVRRGEGEHKNDLLADVMVTEARAISLVKGGLREVSCGYEADYVQTGKGRGRQERIVGNHLALVEEGRAGSRYAIKDAKGAPMKLADRIKAIFAKAQDEALKLAETTDSADETTKTDKEDKSGEKAAQDSKSYDELVSLVKDLTEKVGALAKGGKDEAPAPKKEDESKDEPAPAASSVEERLAKLEKLVAKVLKAESAEAAALSGDEDESEESEDESDLITDEDESEESEDSEGAMVGDDVSRMEILAPGLKAKGKDAKAKALKSAYATADGKTVIDSLTGNREPDYKNDAQVSMIFTAASELLKQTRSEKLASTKRAKVGDYQSAIFNGDKHMTPEKMNEINEKRYGKQA